MEIGVWHIVGILLVLALIAVVGVTSGRRVKDAADFTTGGGNAGPWLVGGAIMGSLIGGQATVGTVQMAFVFGISAWWFTLGAGIGSVVLAIGYVIPLRRSGNMTLLQIIGEEYGGRAECVASILFSIGIFIGVISNILAFAALLSSILPVSVWQAAAISVAVMAVYVIFGGVWGAGMGGIVKLVLLYIASVIGFLL
ncbi:MAG: sodium:solute symporter family protein, partial [Bacillota bacterium]|nr:sodium:solute symporter family protein [Bacillota bacterium]